MLGIFSFPSLSSMYLLWQDACFDLLLIFIELFVFLLLSFKSPLHTLSVLCQMCVFKYFLPVCGLSFHSL